VAGLAWGRRPQGRQPGAELDVAWDALGMGKEKGGAGGGKEREGVRAREGEGRHWGRRWSSPRLGTVGEESDIFLVPFFWVNR
jgi:hypothetical protein